MTDDELKYYKALQPVFREEMGKWRVGDRCIHKMSYFVGIITEHNEKIMARFETPCGISKIHYEPKTDHLFHFPLPIDPVNPERGCWFMLTKENRTDKIFLNELALSDKPALVILKKLASQEGVIL